MAASGLLDCISDGTAADIPVFSVAGLALRLTWGQPV
jgi:hypothetical protein